MLYAYVVRIAHMRMMAPGVFLPTVFYFIILYILTLKSYTIKAKKKRKK